MNNEYTGRANNVSSAFFYFMSFGPFHNPHRGQGRVLSILEMKPEMSQKELSYLLDMSKQSWAELLGKLEKNGFIEREPSEEDRRVSNIKLTEKGAEAAGEMNDEQPSGLEQVFDCLNEEELKHLCEYLQRMIQSLEGQFTDEGEGDLRTRMMERFADMKGRRGFGGRDPRSFGRGGFPGFRDGGFQDARHGGRVVNMIADRTADQIADRIMTSVRIQEMTAKKRDTESFSGISGLASRVNCR